MLKRLLAGRRTLWGLAVSLLLCLTVSALVSAAAPPVRLPLIVNERDPAAASTPTPTITPTPSPTSSPMPTATLSPDETVDLLSQCQNDTGFLYFVHGEVQSNMRRDVESVRITAVGKDIEGNPVWTRSGSALISILRPGDRAPFRIWDQSAFMPPDLVSIELSTEWDYTTQPLQELTVVSHTMDFSEPVLVCSGTARNDTDRVAEAPLAVVSLYETVSPGELVLVGSGLWTTDPARVAPGETCTFRIEIPSYCTRPDSWHVRVVQNDGTG